MRVAEQIPEIQELNAMPAQGFAAALAPLVEGAPRFLARLAAERPFASDEELVDAAHLVAREMPQEEQLELVEAHPPIGAAAEEMSALSREEQGTVLDPAYPTTDAEQEDEGDEEEAEAEAARVDAELAMLNGLYQQRFGFRYVVFVAGRPKAEVILLIERALRNDRDAELRRAVDDAVYIAADRLDRFRGTTREGPSL